MSDISHLVIYLKEILLVLLGCKFADGTNMVRDMQYMLC